MDLPPAVRLLHPQGSAGRLSELIPCLGRLDPNVLPDRRLMSFHARKILDTGRRHTLLHYARANPLAAANRYTSIDATAAPALRAIGYLIAK